MRIVKTQKSFIFIACIMAILVVGGVFMAKKNHWLQTQSQTYLPCDHNEKQEVSWLTYHDDKYHFRIDYPHGLPVRTLENFSESRAYAVDFGGSYYDAPDGPLAVIIEPTQFQTPDAWIEVENKRLQEDSLVKHFPEDYSVNQIIREKQTIIAGYPAIITFFSSFGKRDKTALFVKDSYIFRIYGNGSSFLLCEDEDRINREYERIWDSFRFEK